MLAELIRTTLNRRHFSFLFVWLKRSISLFLEVFNIFMSLSFTDMQVPKEETISFLLLIYPFYLCSNLEPNKYKDCKTGFFLHLN